MNGKCPRCDQFIKEDPCSTCNYPGWPETNAGEALELLDDIIAEFGHLNDVILSMNRIRELRNILAGEYTRYKPELPQNKCRIFGSEIEFNLIVDKEKIKEKCVEIWNNPSKFSTYKNGSDLSYYGFLKFLLVKFPNGTEKQLANIALEK